ncbi:MAG: sugar phosphate isomerase/epimerase [Chloroflexi bacterium]|nr:sugar phosphate isomerase/epimerase [Chloroflexota bacterium]
MTIQLSLVVATPEVGNWPFGLLSGSFEDKARKAAEMGYDGVELLIRDVHAVDKPLVNSTLARCGLKIGALVTGALAGLDNLCLMSPDMEIRTRAMRQLRGFIEYAGEHGSMVDIGRLRGRLDVMPDPVRGKWELADSLREAAEYAAHCGARITLEPLNRYEDDLINNVQDGLEWVERVDHPNVGLLADTFHMNIEDASIEASLREAGSKLWHLHVGDSNRLSPGKGHFDFPTMIHTLRELGYTGFLSAEHLALPDPDTAAQETINYLRQFV